MSEYGSFGEGFSSAFGQQQQLAQKNAALQQQQQLDLTAQINKNINDLYTTAAAVAKANSDAGNPPEAIANQIHSLQSAAVDLATNAANKGVFGQNGQQMVGAVNQRFAALSGYPAAKDASTYSGHVISSPTAENPLGQSLAILNRGTGDVRTQPITPNPAPAPQSSATPNAQVAALTPDQTVNLGDKTITGVSTTDIPEGAPAIPSSAPLKVAQAPGVAGLTSDAIEMRAGQWIEGNPDAFKNLPRSRAGMAVMNAIVNRGTEMAKEQGITPQELNARGQRFKAETAGAQVLGKRSATLEGSIANVVASAPIVSDLSSKIDRTQFPSLNKVLLAIKEGTGDPNVVRLGIAVNTVVNAYARAQGGGNNVLTDTARNEAHALLQLAFTDGQMKAGVDQLLIEMQREKHETGRALNDYLKLRDDAVRSSVPQAPPVNNFITPGGTKFRIIQ